MAKRKSSERKEELHTTQPFKTLNFNIAQSLTAPTPTLDNPTQTPALAFTVWVIMGKLF